MFHAKIAATQPTKKTSRLTSRKRSLPYWSPSLPSTGVATAETSRNAVKSHVAQAVDVCRSRWRRRQRRKDHRLLQRVREPGEREDNRASRCSADDAPPLLDSTRPPLPRLDDASVTGLCATFGTVAGGYSSLWGGSSFSLASVVSPPWRHRRCLAGVRLSYPLISQG